MRAPDVQIAIKAIVGSAQSGPSPVPNIFTAKVSIYAADLGGLLGHSGVVSGHPVRSLRSER